MASFELKDNFFDIEDRPLKESEISEGIKRVCVVKKSNDVVGMLYENSAGNYKIEFLLADQHFLTLSFVSEDLEFV